MSEHLWPTRSTFLLLLISLNFSSQKARYQRYPKISQVVPKYPKISAKKNPKISQRTSKCLPSPFKRNSRKNCHRSIFGTPPPPLPDHAALWPSVAVLREDHRSARDTKIRKSFRNYRKNKKHLLILAYSLKKHGKLYTMVTNGTCFLIITQTTTGTNPYPTYRRGNHCPNFPIGGAMLVPERIAKLIIFLANF